MLEKKKLEDISRLAAFNMSSVLSNLFNSPIQIKIIKAEAVNPVRGRPPDVTSGRHGRSVSNGVKSLVSPQIYNPDSTVAAIKMSVTGDVKGIVLVTFPEEAAFILSDLLLKKEHGAKRELDEKDKSVLKEVGNIIAGSYFTVISDTLNANIMGRLPQLSIKRYDDILNRMVKKSIHKYGMILFVEIELIFEPTKVNGYMLILLEARKIISRFQEALHPM